MANLKFARGTTVPSYSTSGFDDGCVYFNTSNQRIYLRNGTSNADSTVETFIGTDENVKISNSTDTKFFLCGTTDRASTRTLLSNGSAFVGTDNCLYSNGLKCATTADNCRIGSNVSGSIVLGSASLYVIVCRDTSRETQSNRHTGTSVCSVYHNSMDVCQIQGYDGHTYAYGSATMIRNVSGNTVIAIPKLSFSTPDSGGYSLDNITWCDVTGNAISPYGDASTYVYLLHNE